MSERTDALFAMLELRREHAATLAELTASQAARKELLAALKGIFNITYDSQGVVGYHLNGDVVLWDEWEEVEVARTAIEKEERG